MKPNTTYAHTVFQGVDALTLVVLCKQICFEERPIVILTRTKQQTDRPSPKFFLPKHKKDLTNGRNDSKA